MNAFPDISPAFRYNPIDAAVIREVIKYEATPQAIVRFSELCATLTDYGYWYLLGTLWVSYSGHSDLQLWKRLFRSRRPNREVSLMRPSELKVYNSLPNYITAYRAHRTWETDWISYTLNPVEAGKFARQRDVDSVTEYTLRKNNVIALFLRRGEAELLMLDPERARRRDVILVIVAGCGSSTDGYVLPEGDD